MRITGGQARGRRLIGPKGRCLRPTSDLVREALFQILHAHLEFPWESCNVLDLFAGTGALGIEALSRAVREVVFVDHHKSSLDLIRKNLSLCGFGERAKVVRADIMSSPNSFNRVLKYGPFNLIFADPPYSQGLAKKAMEWVAETCALASGGWMVIEEFKGEKFPHQVISSRETEEKKHRAKLSLQLVDSRTYGQTELWFYRSI
ncbi:MAG: 16S rRNA (guanine(966)-N(2))-methyltransferase RsmD [Deltaproteobacteria bacterium]|nr:16S rRNA (guanine(966)-N(2))-methyltransferase RsmD [Deltaproteobacteria bacterium]